MSAGTLLQVFVDIIFVIGFGITWLRLSKPAKDDPRLSRGLQLLQSKIAILEDLSDQIERQVQQVTQLIEAKGREIQNQISAADDQIRKIETSLGKSLEVARIFQDRIPHQEILERQATVKYVKAARLAHQGLSAEEISAQVDLSSAEIDLIIKVNKDRLQFSEEDLPEWAKIESESTEEPAPSEPVITRPPERKSPSLSALGDRFRQAIDGAGTLSPEPAEVAASENSDSAVDSAEVSSPDTSAQSGPRSALASASAKSAPKARVTPAPGTNPQAALRIRKVVFPRVDR